MGNSEAPESRPPGRLIFRRIIKGSLHTEKEYSKHLIDRIDKNLYHLFQLTKSDDWDKV